MADDDGAAPELAPPPPPPALPSYPEMILEAIDALGNDKGSNKTAISGHIKRKYGARLPTGHVSLLTTNLGSMRSAGELFFAKNNYSRPNHGDDEEVEEGEPREPAAADPVSPLRADELQDLALTVVPVPPGLFDAVSSFLDVDGDGLLAPPFVLDADDEGHGLPAPALGVAADEMLALAPDATADDIDVPAPAPAVTADPAAGPVKRGRGRPPKPRDPVAEDSSGAPAEASFVLTDAAAVPGKRGRGRPPKPKHSGAMGTNGEPTATPVTTADANAPVKRGRGRPPKPKDPITEAIALFTNGMPSQRGRPPKKAKVQEAPINAPAAAPGTAAPVKRGRGRPPQGEASSCVAIRV